MDLWDVVRLMMRRWYISAPLLLLTVAAVVGTGLTVSPMHTAEGHVMVLPPSGESAREEDEDRIINPFNIDSIGAAIITRLRNRNLAAEIEDEGYEASWEVDRDIQFLSVIAFQVTAPTEFEAQEVVKRLLREIDRVVERQQEPYDVAENEKVTTVTLGSGENTDILRGNQVRAMVVVFGAFAILTMGATIAFDAVARRRAATPAALAAPTSPAAAPATRRPQYASVNGGRPAEPAPASSDSGVSSGTVYTAGGSRTDGPRTDHGEAVPVTPGNQEVAIQAPIQVNYRHTPKWPVTPSPPHDGGGAPATEADDSTIVLPLSRARIRKPGEPDNENGSRDSNGPGPHEADEH